MSWYPQPIGDQIRRELARFGPAGAMGEIVAAWPAAVGEPIAANAWPARVSRDGTLHVTTSSSAWAFELTQLAASVLARLSEQLESKSPAGLRFAVGPMPEPASPGVETPSRTVPEVRADDRVQGEQIAAQIGDPELRTLVARAAAASLAAAARAPSDRPV